MKFTQKLLFHLNIRLGLKKGIGRIMRSAKEIIEYLKQINSEKYKNNVIKLEYLKSVALVCPPGKSEN